VLATSVVFIHMFTSCRAYLRDDAYLIFVNVREFEFYDFKEELILF
jgi:hypothetical protein